MPEMCAAPGLDHISACARWPNCCGSGSASCAQLCAAISTCHPPQTVAPLQDPGISCMCYDDVNHVVWAGHRNGGIR